MEAGALGDMEAAVEKAKALRAMLSSGLPSKVRPFGFFILSHAGDLVTRVHSLASHHSTAT